MEQENAQAIVLQQPDGQKINLEVQHSTDWVAVGAIVLSLLAFIITIYIVRSSTKAQIKSNTGLIESQNIRLLQELKWEKEKQWLSSFKVISVDYVSTITKFLYHSGLFQEKYLNADLSDKTDHLTTVGAKFEYLRNLGEQAILMTCELDLHLDSKNEENEKIIYLCDYFNANALSLLDEYLTVENTNNLSKLTFNGVIRSTDHLSKDLFTLDDINNIKDKTRIEVLAFVMRKINNDVKNLINKKAA